MKRHHRHTEDGFTLMNMITALGLFSVLSLMAVSNIKELENPLADASFQVSHFLRIARARAISQTMAIEISPSSSTELVASSSDSCTGVFTPLNDLSLTLPEGSSLTNTEWSACFNQRGLSDLNLLFSLQNEEGAVRTLELALGGGVQIQ